MDFNIVKKRKQIIKNIANSIVLPTLDTIEKGGKLGQEGEVREWNGKKYKKTGGKWMPVTDSKEKKTDDETGKQPGGDQTSITKQDIAQLTLLKQKLDSGDMDAAHEIYNELHPAAQDKVPQDVVNKLVEHQHSTAGKDDVDFDKLGTDDKSSKTNSKTIEPKSSYGDAIYTSKEGATNPVGKLNKPENYSVVKYQGKFIRTTNNRASQFEKQGGQIIGKFTPNQQFLAKKDSNKKPSFTDILDNPQSKKLVEAIEGLDKNNTDHHELYKDLVEQLKSKFNYDYKDDEWDKKLNKTKDKVSKAFEILGIEKARTIHPIGTVKKFGGRQYIKTTSGWKYYGKGTGTKAQQHHQESKGSKSSTKSPKPSNNDEKENVNTKQSKNNTSDSVQEKQSSDKKVTNDNSNSTKQSQVAEIQKKRERRDELAKMLGSYQEVENLRFYGKLKDVEKEFRKLNRELKKNVKIEAGKTYGLDDVRDYLGIGKAKYSNFTKKKKYVRDNYLKDGDLEKLTTILGDSWKNESLYNNFYKVADPTNIQIKELKVERQKVDSNNIYDVMAAPQTTYYEGSFDMQVDGKKITVKRKWNKDTTLSMRDINSFL